MSVNYTVSTQLVDADQRKAAQQDAWPQAGSAPTGLWAKGETVVDVRRLAVFPDAAPGAYGLQVVVYDLIGGEISRLPIIPEGGQMLRDHVVLTQVRVNP
jgi:hypothetical protein